MAGLLGSLRDLRHLQSDSDRYLTIGCLYPMSGRAARYGHDSIIAADMAAEEINAAGGVFGRAIRLLCTDSRTDPTYAVRVAERYIREDHVDFLMGVVSSAEALAVTQVSREYRTVFVGTDHASSRLTLEEFQPYYFRVTNNTMQSMRAGALYMSRLPYQTYAFIGPDYEYGHRQWQEFREFLGRLRPDARFVGAAWPKLYAAEYGPHIRAVLELRPEVVVLGFWGGDTIEFIRQALQTPLFERCQVVSFDAGGNYDVMEALGDALPEGLILSARHHNNFPDTAENRRFVQRFFERTNRYPSYPAHGAYVGVHFIATVVRRCGGTDPDDFVRAAEGLVLPTPRDLPGRPSWVRAEDHQIVQDMYVGRTRPDRSLPPASRLLGDWFVASSDQLLPDPEEVARLRAGARAAL